jgi:hypothetical protein
MLEALCELADTHGIAALTAFYFADNMPIIRLLHATGCSRQVDYDCGSSTAELDVRQMIEANYATAGA